MPTVLVVDDEPLILLAVEAMLEDAGYAVVTAANGRQALDLLEEIPRPDLILLDMMMPVMNGAAVLEAMAADPALRTIPVVIVSSLPTQAIQAAATGYRAILRKPCTADQILNMITDVLEKQ